MDKCGKDTNNNEYLKSNSNSKKRTIPIIRPAKLGSGLDLKDGVDQPSVYNKNSVVSNPSQKVCYPKLNAMGAGLRRQIIESLESLDRIKYVTAGILVRDARSASHNKKKETLGKSKIEEESKKAKTAAKEITDMRIIASSLAVPHERKSADYYTSKNTAGLSIEAYIDKAGQAKLPKESDIQYNDSETWHKALEAFLKDDRQPKAVFLDFDGSMAQFTSSPSETLAVHGLLSTIDKLCDKGYKVVILTGRAMEGKGGILPALRRSGADDTLLNKLEIVGSHASQQRGSDTNWEVKDTQEIKDQVEKVKKDYGDLNNELQNSIQQLINENETLRGLKITFDPKAPVGYTIHYRQVEESMHQQVSKELETLLAKMIPEEKTPNDFTNMNEKTYKPFIYRSATKSFEILLNNETTGIDLSKGAIVKIFAEKWGAKVAIAFGDDKTDLSMQPPLKALEDAGKLLQAFVGIHHASSPPEIYDRSTIVLKEPKHDNARPWAWAQEMAVGLLADLAERTPNQRIESQA